VSKLLTQPGTSIIAVDLSSIVELTDERLYELSQSNRELRLERSPEGELIIMSPTGGETSRLNAQLIAQLVIWANKTRDGIIFDSSGGFKLPNGAVRSPDASWVRLAPWLKLSDKQREKFIPLCPDFVLELRSTSDDLTELQEKMREYIDNGAQLGWLIDPQERYIYVYRPQTQVEVLNNPESVTGEPILHGFVLDLTEIW
jgi:Uma2 family endonuclease